MLAEDHLPDSAIGETMDAVIRDQFIRIRDGDPLYYENDAELEGVEENISETRLSHVILRNTEIESLQCNVFFAEHNVDDLDCYLPNEIIEPESKSDEDGMDTFVIGIIGLALTGLIIMAFFGSSAKEEK